ncbi:MAG: hypothetical protein IGR93_18335 [Hydrococcus sp. C42_A2020_068]|jgi:hypothetical protein|nr:hypothetical protein [Hydrococcus sp. C42_A2020_068]
MKYSFFLIILLVICGEFISEEVSMQTQHRDNRDEKTKNQPHIFLTGEITSIKITKGLSGYGINFKAKMTFKNTGDIPIIFLKREFLFPGIGIAEKPEDFEAGKLLAKEYAGMSCSQRGKEWINLRKKLDQPIPPPEETFILMPNEEKVIDAEPVGIGVLIDPQKGFSSKDKESASWETIKNLSQLWIKVRAEPYPSWGLEPDCYGKSFGRELQKRWSKYGYLWLDDIFSEPIPLDLSSALIKTDSQP